MLPPRAPTPCFHLRRARPTPSIKSAPASQRRQKSLRTSELPSAGHISPRFVRLFAAPDCTAFAAIAIAFPTRPRRLSRAPAPQQACAPVLHSHSQLGRRIAATSRKGNKKRPKTKRNYTRRIVHAVHTDPGVAPCAIILSICYNRPAEHRDARAPLHRIALPSTAHHLALHLCLPLITLC